MPQPRRRPEFQFEVRGLDRARIRALGRAIAGAAAPGRAFCCRIAPDAELERLNREFLGHDYPTDVLSFPAPDPAGWLGDVAISADRARAQAARFGHCVEEEVGILLLHGVLHLLGFDHTGDRGRMAREERRLRAELGLPQGLIERVR
jgi:probable rRNA maturation factor